MTLIERFRAYLHRCEAERVRQDRAQGYEVWDAILPGERGNSTGRVRMSAEREIGE